MVDIAFSPLTLNTVVGAVMDNKRLQQRDRQFDADLRLRREGLQQQDRQFNADLEQRGERLKLANQELLQQAQQFKDSLAFDYKAQADRQKTAEGQLGVAKGHLEILQNVESRTQDKYERGIVQEQQARFDKISSSMYDAILDHGTQNGLSFRETIQDPVYGEMLGHMVNSNPYLTEMLRSQYGVEEFTLTPNPNTAEMDENGQPTGVNSFAIGIIGKDGQPQLAKDAQGEVIDLPPEMIMSLVGAQFGKRNVLSETDAKVRSELLAAGKNYDDSGVLAGAIEEAMQVRQDELESERGLAQRVVDATSPAGDFIVDTIKSTVESFDEYGLLGAPRSAKGAAELRREAVDRKEEEIRTDVTNTLKRQAESLENKVRAQAAKNYSTLRDVKEYGVNTAGAIASIESGTFGNTVDSAANASEMSRLQSEKALSDTRDAIFATNVDKVVKGTAKATASATEGGIFDIPWNNIDIYKQGTSTPEEVEAKIKEDVTETIKGNPEVLATELGFDTANYNEWTEHQIALAQNVIIASRQDSFAIAGDADDPDQLGNISRARIRELRDKHKVNASKSWLKKFLKDNG